MNNNMNINGVGTITDGEYNHVSIAGMGKLKGNLKANIIDISGTCSGDGNLNSEELKVNGHMKYDGIINIEGSLVVNGNMKVTNDLSVNDIKVSGNLKIEGQCIFNKANIAGALSIDKNCEGNNFTCNGALNIDGLLTADNIDIYLYKTAKVKEIGGENIRVRTDEKMIKLPIVGKFFNNELICDSIDGDSIYLENTIAKKVSGNNIIIGKGCIIDEIDYKGTVEVDVDSKVTKKTYTGKLNLLK